MRYVWVSGRVPRGLPRFCVVLHADHMRLSARHEHEASVLLARLLRLSRQAFGATPFLAQRAS